MQGELWGKKSSKCFFLSRSYFLCFNILAQAIAHQKNHAQSRGEENNSCPPPFKKELMDHRQADVLWACHAIRSLQRWEGVGDKPFGRLCRRLSAAAGGIRDCYYGVSSQIFSDPYHCHQCSRRARF